MIENDEEVKMKGTHIVKHALTFMFALLAVHLWMNDARRAEPLDPSTGKVHLTETKQEMDPL